VTRKMKPIQGLEDADIDRRVARLARAGETHAVQARIAPTSIGGATRRAGR
jgi:hypothetical protein